MNKESSVRRKAVILATGIGVWAILIAGLAGGEEAASPRTKDNNSMMSPTTRPQAAPALRRENGKVWIDGLQPGERDTSPYAQGLSIILQHLGHRDADYIRVMGYSGVAFALQMDVSGPIRDGKYDVAWWPNDCYVFDMSVPQLSRAFGRELRKVPYTRGQTDYKREYQDRFEPAIIEAINQGHPVLCQQTAAYVITGYDQPNHKPIGLWPTPGQPVFGAARDGIPWGLFVPGDATAPLSQEQAETQSLRWAIELWDETAAAGTKDWDTSTILTGSKAYAKWLELLQQQADDKGLGRDSWDQNLIIHLRYNRAAAVAYLRDLAKRQPAMAAGHLRAAADLYQQVLDATAQAPFYGQFANTPEVRPAKLREYTEMVRRIAQLEAQAIDELRQVVRALPTAAASGAAPATQVVIPVAEVDQFASLIGRPGHVLLDVRTAKEHAAGHIAGGSQVVDFESPDFAKQAAELPRDKTYLIYCRSGRRSHLAAGQMQAMGFEHLVDLKGGILAWEKAGKPVEK